MKQTVLAIAAVMAVSSLGLVGCEKQTKAPFETGVCFQVATNKDGTLRYNPVARNVPQMELCAAELEGARERFVRMGRSNSLGMVGAYQGSFIFLEKEGIYVGQTYEGPRFMSLVRTGDGRLAVPGAIHRVPAQ